GSGHVGGVAEAEQRPGRRGQLVLPDGERRDPHPPTDEQWLAPTSRFGETAAEGADDQEVVARPEIAEPVRPRADLLDQEAELGASPVSGRPRAQNTERPGQERPLAGSPTPPTGRAQHVE